MTDYNDGEWHGWNGGECPVHPKSEVEMIWPSTLDESTKRSKRPAEDFAWHVSGDSPPSLFRVTKPYVEPRKPREFWVNEYECGFGDMIHETKELADDIGFGRIRCIHVREVIEE